MNKISRQTFDKPECLVDKAQEWTDDFILKRQTKPKYWYWHQYKNKKVENILTRILPKFRMEAS